MLNHPIKSASPSTKIISKKTPAIDIPTTCLALKTLFVFREFDFPVADGASACFAGARSGDGTLKNGGARPAGGGFSGNVGGGNGAVVELNGFPSFLHGN